MDLKLDHVVILVKDLEAARTDYQTLGFNVVVGGEHADGATHNALIAFDDGSYIELLAFKRDAPEHRWWRHTARSQGLIDFALLPGNIDQVLAQAKQNGLELQGPLAGGRQRPDGQQINWQTGLASSSDLPFLCADVTSRNLRVPGEQALYHPNGGIGIAALTIAVENLQTSTERYSALLGVQPATLPSPDPDVPQTVSFVVSDTRLILSQPRPGSHDAQLNEHLEQHGEGPYALAIYTQGIAMGRLDPVLSHGVWLELVAVAA